MNDADDGRAPPGVVMTTGTVPAVPGGVIATSDVALVTETSDAATPPNVTCVLPTTKFDPVIVTCVPPAVGPPDGVSSPTLGVDV